MAKVTKTGGSNAKGGSSLFTGIMVGIILGVAMAAGLAWFIMKSPNPFTPNEQHVAKPLETKKTPEPVVTHAAKPATAAEPAVAAAPASATSAASGVDSDKPRFEFYKVLTDKADSHEGAPVVNKSQHSETKSVDAKETKPEEKEADRKIEPQFLQVAAFPSLEDAEKSKAGLALQGLEASIQTANIPNKGVWYRVRLGPYKTADELNRARSALKQNGVSFTQVRTQ